MNKKRMKYLIITAPLFSSRLFEYGLNAGDQELLKSLDVTKKIVLTYPLRFYGLDTSTIYISSNGGIGVEKNIRSYQAGVLPSDLKLIAVFWNRNDLRSGGHVYFREVTAGRVLERGQSEIRYQYDEIAKVKTCLLVTWEKMQPLGATPLPDDNTNTFQVALFITDNGTFVNFIYKNIGWTQGAEAGFNKGDRKEYFALPTSGTGNIMYLEEYGNTGIPGEWMFKLGDAKVERCKAGIKGDTCDEECSAGEWGPDCALCCHCASGSCNAINGDCVGGKCSSCWTGPPSCQQKKDDCHALATEHCVPNAISFADHDRCGEPIQRCQCLSGFKGDGYTKCDDIDECSLPNSCHQNAICNNTPGRYFCTCAEGFIGDGINECTISLLYSYHRHQELPKDKSGKLVLHLKQPLRIFGKQSEQLTVSSFGIISIDDDDNDDDGSREITAIPRLASSGLHGIAPFYANINHRRGDGRIFANETFDTEVLSRATKTVVSNTDDKSFMATSAVLVTFINVTGIDQMSTGNSFQILLIGGTNKQRQNKTYAQLLYKDLTWIDRAEAGILTYGSKNPLLLPGSGTDDIIHLTRDSNIAQPGQWLFRVDSDDVQMCFHPNLVAPYCEEYQDHQPHPTTLTSPKLEESEISDKEKSEVVDEAENDELIEIPGPQVIQPVLVDRLPSDAHLPSQKNIIKSNQEIVKNLPNVTQKIATPHVPLISLDRLDIEDLPPDAFDITFPPFITVVPKLFTSSNVAGKSEIVTGVENEATLSESGISTSTEISEDALSAVHTSVGGITTEVFTKSSDSWLTSTEVTKRIKQVKPTKIDFDYDDRQTHIFVSDRSPTEEMPESAIDQQQKKIQPSQKSTEKALPTEVTTLDYEENDLLQSITTSKPLFIFTTISKVINLQKRPMPTKPKLITAFGTSLATPHGPYDIRNDVKIEASSSSSLRAERHFRDMYFPNHQQIYPIGTATYALRKDSKHFNGSYEDHLEKAARLSSELSSYNQNGRVSLYGSYWNLTPGNASANSTNGLSTSNRQSPYSQYSTQQVFIFLHNFYYNNN
ncbi:unnamed protein product [Thelazia callipaeda]|uniref:EGF-like domain-containing protein n=1 Tax=Thelazia callipaeda TaxID=103827 RepID=A0A0N5CN19_THECL|nr:unnamed protein product [Thelazia callipaeda]